MKDTNPFDVAIIGGGPAGLSGALVLGRARRSVVIIDEGKARNRVTRETHGFLTRDGSSPGEFRAAAAEQMRRYPSVSFVQDAAAEISGADGAFRIVTSGGDAYEAKKLLFAAGKKDRPLDIEGLADVYGISAFVCPYCDGWELRDQPLAVITSGEGAMHMAKTLAGWTSSYAICTNGPDGLTDEQREALAKRNIPLYDAPIERIESKEGMVEQIVLRDGRRVACTGIFFAPTLVAGSDLPQSLGCEMTEAGSLVINDFGGTNVPGVFGAGDAATIKYQAIMAAAMGSMAAVGINMELLQETWDNA
ncbi:NAD(P)/FAD-dependent oxidoreductase [Paenibacillus methanolicus]|uniref:Thioredoxin reductase n=1 Tax=Paenibacillus methanolicus TaxID=582686 RepID=A0A5S5CGP8_9BACL|nr:NAD(P)/FAD-dependent oxidoreductase [Paenibacillus methanolicus]TYP78892.1 thioredoxin reductase [Paenibacillus methanolicus]